MEGISFFPIFRAPLPFSIGILQKQQQYSKNGNILKSGKSVHFAKVRQKWCFKVQKTKTLKSFFCHSTEKNGSKKYGTFENWYFKKWQKWPFCTGYREAILSVWGWTSKWKKHTKNDPRNTLQRFYAKKRLLKNLIFEKLQFSKGWQKWPFCKGKRRRGKWSEIVGFLMFGFSGSFVHGKNRPR